jgi:hypothetical protein
MVHIFDRIIIISFGISSLFQQIKAVRPTRQPSRKPAFDSYDGWVLGLKDQTCDETCNLNQGLCDGKSTLIWPKNLNEFRAVISSAISFSTKRSFLDTQSCDVYTYGPANPSIFFNSFNSKLACSYPASTIFTSCQQRSANIDGSGFFCPCVGQRPHQPSSQPSARPSLKPTSAPSKPTPQVRTRQSVINHKLTPLPLSPVALFAPQQRA